jgi:signal peptidase I
MVSRGERRVTITGPDESDATVHGSDDSDATSVLPAGSVATEAPPEVDSKPGKGESGSGSRTRRVAIEWIVLIAAALLIAFLIKTFLFQAFYIPSESMEPTLDVGDRVLVNKLSYKVHDVNRGDIVVFDAPPCAESGDIKDLVKRVIGLPGDTVTSDGKSGVLINGHALKEPYLPKGTPTTFNGVAPSAETGASTSCIRADGTEHCGKPANSQPGCVVPKGDVFMLGDNRTNSHDGRYFGPIKESSIVGRVFVKIWPIDDFRFF